MSDLARLCLPAALAAAAPAAAGDCLALTRHFDFCPGAGAWTAAEWEQFGDFAALRLGDLTLDFTEDFAGRNDDAQASPEAALSAVVDRMLAGGGVRDHGGDSFAAGPVRVARRIVTVSYPGDPTVMRAVMVAEANGRRVMLLLSAPEAAGPASLAARSREVAGLLRPAGGG